MATEVIMPKLGLTMERGTIGAWLAEENQEVSKGQPLLEVVTDKVVMEVESQVGGVLRKILVPAGEEVAVSTPIGIIAAAGEDISGLLEAGAPQPAAAAEPARGVPAAEGAPLPAAAPRPGRKHRASPRVRRIALERGIDLSHIQGSGPGGRIVSADLDRPAAAAPAAGEWVEWTRVQQVAAERLGASYREVPHIHLGMHVSALWLQQLRQGYALEGTKVSYNDLILRAAARALREYPRLNSILEKGGVRQLSEIDIGIAVDSPRGLLVPVVRRADARSVEEIAAECRRLIAAARGGELKPDDLSGGSFTISNLGMFGVAHFTAIINPPQVAILAVGAIEKRVVALENDALCARPMLTLNLAVDHRAVDGALAARFLGRLKEILESPGLSS